MTTGHVRASSAGMVADAFATFLDDGFRLRTDAITARRRLVASLFAVATPLVDGGGRQVTRLATRAGEALWRGARTTGQVGATVADEAADAGREGARAVRDAAARRSGSSDDGATTRGTRGAEDRDLADVVQVVEVVEPGPADADRPAAGTLLAAELAAADDVLDTGDVDELDVDELEVDELEVDELEVDELEVDEAADEDLFGEGLDPEEMAAEEMTTEEVTAEEAIPAPPAVLTDATGIGGDRGGVPDAVTEEALEQITADQERRTARRGTGRPRTASRPARRERPREERRETAASGRERRG